MPAKRVRDQAAPGKRKPSSTPEPAQVLLEKLQTSETKYRRLFETAQDGILLLDAKTGEITDVNPYLLDLVGYPYDRIAGKKLWDIGPFVDRATAKQAFETLLKDRYIRYEDLPLQTATGARVQVEFVSNVYPVDGRDVIQCNIRDITQRKACEAARGSEEMQKDLALAASELGIWNFDLVTGTARRSLRHDQIFGYPALLPEWTYELFLSHVIAEDRDAVAESFGKALSSKTDWDFTCRIRRNDGEVRWIWAKGNPEFNERHEPVTLVGLVQDITERKQEEAVLAESELKYRQVVDNANQAIFAVQGQRIVYLNPMTSKMIGHSSEEVMAKPFTEFIHPGDRDMIVERNTRRLKGEDVPSIYGFRIVRQDGAVRWAELSAVLIDWQGEPATLNFLTDVTERMSAEIERERLLQRQLVLNRITLTLGASTGLKSTLRTLRSEIRSLLDADGFFVSRYQKETGLITALFIVDEGVERDVSTFPSIPLAEEGKGMQSSVLRTGQPLNVPNWIERERTMQTVYHIESDGALAPVPPEDEREGCTKSALLVPLMFEGEAVGVLQVQSRRLNAYSDEDVELLAGVANVAAVSIQNALLVEEVRDGLEGTIAALARTTEMRDPYTSGHQQRVSQLACAIAGKMGLDENTVDSVRVSGLLHDVGKASIPSEILSKPGKLTAIEFSLVKEHARIGFHLLSEIAFPWPVAEIVLQHHERLDGSGYPKGLKGDAIKLGARILAVADVVEAMSSHRPYRPALGIGAALQEIQEHQGKLYDSGAVEACVQLLADGFEFAPTRVSPAP